MSEEEEKYQRAQEKVAKIKKFYRHLASWMITSIFLMILFFVLRMPPWITLVVVAGWGIGVASEAVEVLGFPGMDKNWEERKIKEELDRMDRRDVRTEEVDEDETLDLPELRKAEKKWNDSDIV